MQFNIVKVSSSAPDQPASRPDEAKRNVAPRHTQPDELGSKPHRQECSCTQPPHGEQAVAKQRGQRWKPDAADHQQAEHSGEEQERHFGQEPMAVDLVAQDAQGQDGPGGRDGQPDAFGARFLAGQQVEARQPKGSTQQKQQAPRPDQDRAEWELAQMLEHQNRRRDAEVDHIHDAVQVLAKIARDPHAARNRSIQRVSDVADQDEEAGKRQVVVNGQQDGGESATQGREGD